MLVELSSISPTFYLRTAFMHVDSESVRIQSNPQYLFTLLGSTFAKAVRRMLMKSTPDCQQVVDPSASFESSRGHTDSRAKIETG